MCNLDITKMKQTIKDILFDYIREKQGIVDYHEITYIILTKTPKSKWNITHWRWYKTQIVSPNGKYHNEFPDYIIKNITNAVIKASVQTKREKVPNLNTQNTSLFINNSINIEKNVAKILGHVTHHIHPEIVTRVTEENKLFEHEFSQKCHPALNIKDYFFEGSDCLFPGIRRPINKEKEDFKQWKNAINEKDGTIFNDNTYPRHIWTYLSLNKGYSGGARGTWAKSGLEAFELAHIFGHKEDEKGLEKKVFKQFNSNLKPYSLFTSVSNVVLIPKGLTKPTDHMDIIKICFYKRHLDLYGNNLIGLDAFDESLIPEWYNEIKWLDPILPFDWKDKIDNVLKYRNKHLIEKYSK